VSRLLDLKALSDGRARYLLNSAQKRIKNVGHSCPSCGCRDSSVLARKYIVTELRRCGSCMLAFRTPTTSKEENAEFYQEDYSEGVTTTLPSDAELKELLACEFRGTEKDYTHYTKLLVALGVEPHSRVFDFGCSWGYGSWQLQRAGFNVRSYEISKRRCAFARDRLGIDAQTHLPEADGSFDVVFSSHVLEHVPSVSEAIGMARGLLRPGGLFVAFTPNGSYEFRMKNPEAWLHLWGSVHPNFLDSEFYRKAFAEDCLLMASNPYDLAEISRWKSGHSNRELSLEGDELLVAARL
jgi:2-polyprenyl-3-methyl-5-hydroxy-6-metoxy-1,4-benzoquinol methylase